MFASIWDEERRLSTSLLKSAWPSALRRRHDRQLYEAGFIWAVMDALRRFLKVGWLGPENIGDESLRVPVIQREPAGLDLHHDSVAWQKDVIGGGHGEFVEQRL